MIKASINLWMTYTYEPMLDTLIIVPDHLSNDSDWLICPMVPISSRLSVSPLFKKSMPVAVNHLRYNCTHYSRTS